MSMEDLAKSHEVATGNDEHKQFTQDENIFNGKPLCIWSFGR